MTAALEVACPVCGAGKGELCDRALLSPSNRRNAPSHQKRWLAYWRTR